METRRIGREDLDAAQKAAAILVAMGKERASKMLKHFKREELKLLIDAGHTLKNIPQPDLAKLVREFEAEFTKGVGLLDSADRMRSIVDETLTQEELDAVFGRVEAEPEIEPDTDVWAALEEVENERIVEYAASEHPQVFALICSRLSTTKTASLLSELDRDERSAVLARMLSSGTIAPRAQNLIEHSLMASFGGTTSTNTGTAERERVAEVISEFDHDEADAIFDDLSEVIEEANVDAVRQLVFRFEDIITLPQSARVLLMDPIQTETVTDALRDTDGALREAILSALSQRTRRMIEAELSDPAGVKPDAIIEARRMVVARAKKLAADGEIELVEIQEAA